MAKGWWNLQTLCLDHSAPGTVQCSSKVAGKGLKLTHRAFCGFMVKSDPVA